MFAKIFEQIYDSSIAEDWRQRIVFQDMLVLCDEEGVVDVTPEALARRTNLPIEIVRAAIPLLEAPDPHSRTPDHEGRRIIRLDEHRTWGWRIVNFRKYRESASKEMLRMSEADRKRTYRARYGKSSSPTPQNQIQNQRQRQTRPAMSQSVPDMSRTCPGQDTPPVSAAQGPGEGNKPEALRPFERVAMEKELGRVSKELSGIGRPADYVAGSRTHQRATVLKQRQAELRTALGVVA